MLALQRNIRYSLMRQRIWQQGRGSKRFREEFDFMDFLSQRTKENDVCETVDMELETKKKVKKLKRYN